MKKFLALLTVSIFILSACTKSIVQMDEQEVDPTKFVINDEPTQTVDPNLPRNILSRLYSTKDLNEDLKTCDKFTEPNDIGECYWIVAMKNKDSKFCNLIPKNADEEFKKCNNQIHFKSTEGDIWNLKKGFPPYGDPDTLIYKGKATLRGWIIYRQYFDNLLPYFHVQNTESLPIPNNEFTLYSENKTIEEVIEKLKDYSEQNPATIIVDTLSYPMESWPKLNVVEITTPSP